VKGSTLSLVEVITWIHDGQLEDGALGELHRLLHYQPTLRHSGFERVHISYCEVPERIGPPKGLSACNPGFMEDPGRWNSMALAPGGFVARLGALRDSAAREDRRKPYDDEVRVSEMEFLRQFARQRPQFVLQDVAQLRGRR
jgi:hypothetical protein